MPAAQRKDEVVGYSREGRPVTFEDVTLAARDMTELLSLKLTTGRCAKGFIVQLALAWCGLGQPLGRQLLLVDVHAVADQIGALEHAPKTRAVPTKPATMFCGPLEGLWHQHWFQAGFIVPNLLQESEKAGVGLIYERLRDHYGITRFDGKSIDETDIKLMAHAMVFDALDRRAGNMKPGVKSKPRLTGEWIVFAKCGRRNIYLTLAAHGETNEAILKRCLPALDEFPELAATPPFNRQGRKLT